ncbi:hypothetical protein HDU81_006452 [Chytriomyces hyalinus]|nr:hypothetical protein HDU81_006452 [Chytriomyces hyalinus]
MQHMQHMQPVLGGFPVSNQQQQHPAPPRIWWAPITQSGLSVLNQAIALGVDADGSPLYACRMAYEGGMQVGKLRRDSSGVAAYISYGGTERVSHCNHHENVQVLCGDRGAVELLRVDGRLVSAFVATIAPVEAGRESNGNPLFVAVTADRGIGIGTQVGKCGMHLQGMSYGFMGKERSSECFLILVHAHLNRGFSQTHLSHQPAYIQPHARDVTLEFSNHNVQPHDHQHQHQHGHVDHGRPIFNAPPPQVAVFWRQGSAHAFPDNAIPIGTDKDGGALFAARIQMEGSLQVGKARSTGGCFIGYGGKEVHFEHGFEVLCGDPFSVTWARQEGAFSHTRLEGLVPIEAGHESDGTTLYIGVHRGCDGEQVGKCSARLDDGVHYGLFGSEIVAPDYFVAAYRSSC